jgi:hypothetical protein
MSCLSVTPVEVFSTSTFPRNLIALLSQFYQHIVRAWSQFAGGAVAGILSLDINSTTPRPLIELNSHSTYVIGRRLIPPQPDCIGKFLPRYGPLHWSETWDQIHLQSLDRAVIDVNWKITHGVIYTASRLVTGFGMANIDLQCHCRADVETLKHLFFECRYACILVGWVYFNFMMYDGSATPFTVEESIPSVELIPNMHKFEIDHRSIDGGIVTLPDPQNEDFTPCDNLFVKTPDDLKLD